MNRRDSIRAMAATVTDRNKPLDAANNADEGAGDADDKTYVWVKLTDGKFNPNQRATSNVANKKRGAPGSLDIWGWSPGYYHTSESNSEEYHLALINLDGRDDDDDAPPGVFDEHTLPKSNASKLLEAGDIVLANPWEGVDFCNRLNLPDDDGDDESDYDYDNDDSDDDKPGRAEGKVSAGFLDQPDGAPPPNLIDLTHLHEPAVVHALRYRFEKADEDMSSIYTDTGPILLAVNPFKRDESGRLYGDETVDNYRREGEAKWLKERRVMGGGKGGGDMAEEGGPPLPPHVYSVSDRTFRTMMTRLNPVADAGGGGGDKEKSAPAAKAIDQSILVSGESGAGKTWTTKLLMAYLSKLSENPDSAKPQKPSATDEKARRRSSCRPVPANRMSIESRILESNPVMESFGNARTVRNDNSSRFGKYIEMKFLAKGGKGADGGNVPGVSLVGAAIETYLLEKVRLVHQSPGERNYHIFYELFSQKDSDGDDEGDDDDLEGLHTPSVVVEKIGLTDYDMEDFSLINMSDTYDRRDGVPDDETFGDLKQAMKIMGFKPEERTNVFGVTTALLHASNLTFESVGEVECKLEMDNPHLEYVVDLLGITKEGLNQALCYYEITIGGRGGKGGETHRKVLSQEQAEKGILALIKAAYGALFLHLVKRINESIAGDSSGKAGGKAKGKGKEKGASIGILDIFGFESFLVNSFEQLCINYCNEALQQQFNLFVLRNEQEEYDREGIPWSFIEFPENQDVLDLIAFKGTGILNILHDQCRTPGASDRTFAQAMYKKCTEHKRFEVDARQKAEQLFGVHHYAGLVEYDVTGFVEKTRDELPKSGSDLLQSSNNELVKTIAEILQAPDASAKKKPGGRAKSQRPTVGIQFSNQLQSLRKKIDATSPNYIRCIKPNNALVPDVFDAALIADQLRCAGVIEAVRVSRLGYPQRFGHNQFTARYRILGKKMRKKSIVKTKKFNPTKALVHAIAQRMPEDQRDDIGIQVGKTKVFLRRSAYDLLEKLRRERISLAAIVIQKAARKFVCQKLYKKASCAVLTVQCFVRMVLATKVVEEMRRLHNSIIIQMTWRRYAARNRYLSAKFIARWCQTHYRGSVGRRQYTEYNRQVKATYLQSRWRGYRALQSFKAHITAVFTIQCAWRCHVARKELAALKAEARDFANVAKERDALREETIALKNKLQKLLEEGAAAPAQVVDTVAEANKDAEIETLKVAADQLSKEKENAVNELKEVNETLDALKMERESAVGDLDELKRINEELQAKLDSRDEELQSRGEELKSCQENLNSCEGELQCAKDELEEIKKDLEELKKSKVTMNGSPTVQESSAVQESPKVISETIQGVPGVIGIDDAQVIELKNELESLKEMNSALQMDNDQLKAENLSFASKSEDLTKSIDEMKKNMIEAPARRLSETPELQKDRYVMTEEDSDFAISDSKSTAIERKSVTGNPSVCTSLTTDVTDEEVVKLKEENQALRKQLSLLRVNRVNSEIEFDGDEDYEDSLVRESESDASEFIGEASDVPEHVMKQILAEVEIVTEEVIIKTRAESESKIAELESEIKELKGEMERNRRLAKYDLDDMTRVNRSLRGELETLNEEKEALEEELEMKNEEFDALNEDVERFAETFAGQHGELQNLETQLKKLQLENEKLKAAAADEKKRINELEAQADVKNAVGSELGKLWDEISRLKETPSADSSGKHDRRSRLHTQDSSDSEISSEDSDESD